MKFCGNCGQSIPDEARACPYCGTMQSDGPIPAAKASGGFADILKKYKLWFIIAGVIAVLAICWFAFVQDLVFGTYETPIEYQVDRYNDKNYNVEDRFINMYGGLGKSQLKDIYEILSSSDNWKDVVDDYEDEWKDYRDGMEDGYGSDWKISYEITDTIPLDADDLKEIKSDRFKYTGKSLIETAKYISNLDNSDLKELAEDMGLSKDQLKELAELLKELGNVLKEAELSEGYNVEFEITIKGRDDDRSSDGDVDVVKVGHNWIEASTVYPSALTNYLYDVGYWVE